MNRGAAEPPPSTAEPAALFAQYLEWYRAKAIEKVAALPVAEQRRPVLPSGWAPLELLQHLAFMDDAGSSGATSARTCRIPGATTSTAGGTSRTT